MKRLLLALLIGAMLLAWLPMSVSAAEEPTLTVSPTAGPPETPVTVTGAGYAPGASVDIVWYTMEGNRVSGRGFVEVGSVIATAVADAEGNLAASFVAPYDLGGPAHRVEAVVNEEAVAETSYLLEREVWITPTSGPAGTVITVRVAAGGWTHYDNNVAITYDNAFLGFACSFNSQGNISVYVQARGGVGKHVLGVHPALYYGPSEGPTPWKHALLNPNDLPVLYETQEFIFEVTESVGTVYNQATDLRSATAPDSLSVLSLPAEGGTGSEPFLGLGNAASGIVDGPLPYALSGFPADTEVDLRWNTVTGQTKIEADKNRGWVFEPRVIELGSVTTDASGDAWGVLTLPEDYGGDHLIEASVNGEVLASGTWKLVPTFTASLSEDGSRITLHATGLGWEKYTAPWDVLIDNRLFGTVTALTSSGSIDVSIPVVGEPGLHTIDIHEGTNGWPYLNMHESPWPWEPVARFTYVIEEPTPEGSAVAMNGSMPLWLGAPLIVAIGVIGLLAGRLWQRRETKSET